MKLAIISHTEHFKTPDGTIVGWGPTITEINNLLEVFDTIYHVAMFHESKAPLSALPYVSNKIIFVPLPVLGGHSLVDKGMLLYKAPIVLATIRKTLKQVDWFQFRAPTGIGVYVIPFLSLCNSKPGWFKYAGNWNQENPPLGYGLQRKMLKKQSRIVTVNGSWENQPQHCLTFENPCLTDTDLTEGEKMGKQKNIEGKLTCCFVGRLEKPKGVERIIKAIGGLSVADKKRINVIHLVGDGPDKNYFMSLAKDIGVCFVFHGFLSRDKVFDIYRESHVFLMPTTASEGFPKVLAEAMNYGCVPVVSNISSIGQYIINNETGFLLEVVTKKELLKVLRHIFDLKQNKYKQMVELQRNIVFKFSFNHYNKHIISNIISKIN